MNGQSNDFNRGYTRRGPSQNNYNRRENDYVNSNTFYRSNATGYSRDSNETGTRQPQYYQEYRPRSSSFDGNYRYDDRRPRRPQYNSSLNPNVADFVPHNRGYQNEVQYQTPYQPIPRARNLNNGFNPGYPQERGFVNQNGYYQNYREADDYGGKFAISSKTLKGKNGSIQDDFAQRERLSDQLTKGTYECMVCCETIVKKDRIWSCRNCFHLFHLHCVRKWVQSAAVKTEGDDSDAMEWRCPACQQPHTTEPKCYFCFCGKQREPQFRPGDVPHSCGELCGRQRSSMCVHRCNILCHPGPCPSCPVMVSKFCACGKEQRRIQCGNMEPITCDAVCAKLLDCGVHQCVSQCHPGPCGDCEAVVAQTCFCMKESRVLPCSKSTANVTAYPCGQPCDRKKDCGIHSCEDVCHEGSCKHCEFMPGRVSHCPCGRTPLSQLLAQPRVNCTDPIPTCGLICDASLICGPTDDLHCCMLSCHHPPCPPCKLSTSRKCRCRASVVTVPCSQLVDGGDITCKRKCPKRRSCGKHKCPNFCCVDQDHICPLVCGKKLGCGNHSCDRLCHIGHCPQCLQTSFEELSCFCGATILYPPIACGTKPPECKNPCTRQHACDHPVTHKCHSAANCPPCTVLTEKWCYGGHAKRFNVPCFLNDVSCGKPCDKPLLCGKHLCLRTCHPGECTTTDSGENMPCTQMCASPKPFCGHPCAASCHTGPCPNTPCRTKVTVSCQCGRILQEALCCDVFRQQQRIMAIMANRSAEEGQIDVSEAMNPNQLKRLECTEECSVIERNRRFAEALQIEDPELTGRPTTPAYTDFLKNQARLNPRFVSSIQEKLVELVRQLDDEASGKRSSRRYAFPPMSRDQRHVVHELAECFRCDSVAYDKEPVRNICVTAFKNRSLIPCTSVLTVVQRETSGVQPRAMPAPPTALQRAQPVVGKITSAEQIPAGLQVLRKADPAPKPPPVSTASIAHIDHFDD